MSLRKTATREAPQHLSTPSVMRCLHSPMDPESKKLINELMTDPEGWMRKKEHEAAIALQGAALLDKFNADPTSLTEADWAVAECVYKLWRMTR